MQAPAQGVEHESEQTPQDPNTPPESTKQIEEWSGQSLNTNAEKPAPNSTSGHAAQERRRSSNGQNHAVHPSQILCTTEHLRPHPPAEKRGRSWSALTTKPPVVTSRSLHPRGTHSHPPPSGQRPQKEGRTCLARGPVGCSVSSLGFFCQFWVPASSGPGPAGAVAPRQFQRRSQLHIPRGRGRVSRTRTRGPATSPVASARQQVSTHHVSWTRYGRRWLPTCPCWNC